MLSNRLTMLMGVIALFAPAAHASDKSATPRQHAFEQNRRLGHGVNVLGYDPIWQNRDQARFQDRYFRLIKNAGFGHVRINLYPFRDGRLSPNNDIAATWFDTLDWAISNARGAGLMVILDLHEYETMAEDPTANRVRLLAAWRQIAQHCQKLPDDVLFELLNEPNGKLTPELWNALSRETLRIVRASNPRRTVIVGPGSWNSIDALSKLDLPEEDELLIATVHYYNPFAFTHQGAAWTIMKNTSGVTWEGTAEQRRAVRTDFERADAWAKQHRRPMFLGEFGALENGDLPSRARWAACVAKQAEDLGWSWAWWQFEGNFALYDSKRDAWVAPLLRALAPKTPTVPAMPHR
ncbi:MAG: glycoside hydrolase family 5 protein [Planctomycetaceae bacterium]|nr:glycoside hydrolase family 5 protein [Planctomycetaceae bacterium]